MTFHDQVGIAPTPLPSLGRSSYRFRPLMIVRLAGSTDFVVRDLHLDAGTDDTVFPEKSAADVGLDLSQAPQVTINLIGRGSLLCRYALARFRITDFIETYEWDAVVGSTSVSLEYPVLGWAGFLQFSDADFRGADKEVIFTPNRTFSGQVT